VRPAHEKHLKWREWAEQELSHQQIADKHKDETGEEVTRDAVSKALKRLPPDHAADT
jgi:hypothetical protein